MLALAHEGVTGVGKGVVGGKAAADFVRLLVRGCLPTVSLHNRVLDQMGSLRPETLDL